MPSSYPTGLTTDLPIEIDRESGAEEFVAANGRRITTSYWTGDERHLTLIHPVLREAVTAQSPWNAYTEPGALRALWSQIRMVGSVTIADPEGGSAITVKFSSPIKWAKIAEGVFAAQVELVEVL